MVLLTTSQKCFQNISLEHIKNKMHLLTEHVMLEKISLAQSRFIHQEITGDNSKADTQKQAEYNEHICCIIKNADPALC